VRLLTILAAYLIAGFVGAISAMVLLTRGSVVFDPSFFFLIFSTGSIFAAPVAVVAVIFSELRYISGPFAFAVFGIGAGLFIGLLLSDGFYLQDTALMCLILVIAALTYWLIAWWLFPPKETAEEPPIS